MREISDHHWDNGSSFAEIWLTSSTGVFFETFVVTGKEKIGVYVVVLC